MSKDRFGELYRRFEKLVAYLKRLGRPEEDARDLAQDAMIDMMSRIDCISPGAEWSYVKRIASSRAINQATRTPASQPIDDKYETKASSAEQQLLADEFQRRFGEALRELPRLTRLILVRRAQGAGFSEIAKELDIDSTAARSRVSRAYPLLRERLGDPPPGVKWLELGDDE